VVIEALQQRAAADPVAEQEEQGENSLLMEEHKSAWVRHWLGPPCSLHCALRVEEPQARVAIASRT
jgi:hypothetical protein